MLIQDILKRQKYNSKIAIKHGEKELSYREWNNQSYQISKVIDRVATNSKNIALFFPNSIEYAIAYFSILFSEKVIIPIEIHSKGLEIMSTLEYCEIDLIITSQQYCEFLIENLSTYKHKVLLFFIEDKTIKIIGNDNELVTKTDSNITEITENSVAIMLHTSGTTSNPKRVMLTHRNLISNIESNIMSLKLMRNDKVLIAMPMQFGYCNTAQFLTHLYLSATIVILYGVFLPKIFFQTLQTERITNFTGVPTMLIMLLDYKYYRNYDISSLRYICFGGGKMPIIHLKELINRFNTVGFVQTYGQTEASPRVTALMPTDSLRKIGSVGLPIPNVEIAIFDNCSNLAKNNVIGDVVVKGQNVMKGYYKQDVITKETIIDGWLHTGDLGYMDAEGYVYLTGRKKNIIISGGINIYPEEIEEILLQHDNVKEAVVFGKSHDLLGEVPVAKVVCKENQLDIDALRKFCRAHMAVYKIPIYFDVVDNLPKTYTNKIKRY